MLHLAMLPIREFLFLCVIYLLVGSQKIVFRDIPSVSDDRFPIMRKMMNTNALATNDPMKGLGDITISSPMKDIVQDIFTAAEKLEEQFAESKTEVPKPQPSSSDDYVDLAATKDTIKDIFEAAANLLPRKTDSNQDNTPLLLHVDYSDLSRIQNTIKDIFAMANDTPRKLTPRQIDLDQEYLDLLDIGSSISATADTGKFAQETGQQYDYQVGGEPNPDNYWEDNLNSGNVDQHFTGRGQTRVEDNSSLVIKKCCRFNEVLNNNHECVVSDDAGRFNYEIQKLSIADITRVDYNMFRCQKKMIHELIPVEILPDGHVNVADGEWLLEYQQCLELTEITEGYIEGISLIVCDSSGSQGLLKFSNPENFYHFTLLSGDLGHVTKCCPRGEALSEDHTSCAPLPDGDDLTMSSLMPSRMIRTSSHFPPMPTGHYHLLFENMTSLCEGGNTLSLAPQGLFTDGTMSVEHEGNFTLVHYSCTDRVLVDGEVWGLVALVCEADLHLTVPKCCHQGEIFSHKEMECVSSRVSKFSTAELYGQTEVNVKS